MENQRKLDKLSKLAGLLLDNTITPTQAKQLVELLVNLNTKQKEDMVKTFGEMSDSFTQEAYTKLQEAVSMVSQKHSDALLEVRQLTNKQRKEHEVRLEELQSLLVEIKSIKVENGKDADEELIVEKVLERIEIPEYKETILDDGKQIADKLNTLEEVIDQKVIKGLTKKITDLSSNIAHNVIKGSSTTLVNGKLAKNINFSGSASVSYNGDNANVTITGGGSGAVDSVNGQTGVVVLDTGDIAEATDLNYVSDAQLTVIGNTSGTNTGDVTLAGEDYLSIVGQVITANAIDLDNLSATGTPDNTKFLRGDNTWATPASGGGTVTSVDMTVPTGLTISGNPVTTSGTLVLDLDIGYVIPLQTTLDGFVPYTGATATPDLGAYNLEFDASSAIYWDNGGANSSYITGGATGSLIGFYGAGTGHIYFDMSSITVDRTITWADSSGTPVLSVNGVTPDGAGDVTISAGATQVFNEVPTGAINTSNTIYTTANNFTTGTTRVYLNGVRQILSVDYTETDTDEITFTTAPFTGDSLIIDYQQ